MFLWGKTLNISECKGELEDLVEQAASVLSPAINLESVQSADLINELFRCVHTLKGIAGFAEWDDFEGLSHALEQILALARIESTLSRAEILLLNTGLVLLENMLDKPEEDYQSQISSIESEITKTLGLELTEEQSSELTLSSIQSEDGLYNYKITLDRKEFEWKYNQLENDLLQAGEFKGTIVEEDHILLLYTSRLDENCIHLFVENYQVLNTEDFEKLLQESTETKLTALSQSKEESKKEELEHQSSSKNKYVRISAPVLERLMNLSSELVLLRNQQLMLLDGSSARFEGTVNSLNHLTTDIQELVMQTQMLPFRAVFKKLERNIYTLAHKLGKEIHVEITGSNVEVDRNILDKVSEPLTHMVRNSCDHGIEHPTVRKAKGKKTKGSIKIEAKQMAGKILISVQDDGAGIDPTKVAESALKKGIVDEAKLASMSLSDIQSLIFAPGFSTRDEVSKTSGRGVGMDVVKSMVENLGGTLDLKSEPEAGASITLHLPISMAVMNTLVIDVDSSLLCIPQINVKEVIQIFADEMNYKIDRMEGYQVLHFRGMLIPILDLNSCLNFSLQKRDFCKELENGDSLNFVITQVGQDLIALSTDAIVGTQELVSKPLHPMLNPLNFYQGASIMGDGKISLVLNLMEISKAIAHLNSYQHAGLNEQAVASTEEFVLFQNDQHSAFFAYPMKNISRILELKETRFENIPLGLIVHSRESFVPAFKPDAIQRSDESLEDINNAMVIVDKYTSPERGVLAFGDLKTIQLDLNNLQSIETVHESYRLTQFDNEVVHVIDNVNFFDEIQKVWNFELEPIREESLTHSPIENQGQEEECDEILS